MVSEQCWNDRKTASHREFHPVEHNKRADIPAEEPNTGQRDGIRYDHRKKLSSMSGKNKCGNTAERHRVTLPVRFNQSHCLTG